MRIRFEILNFKFSTQSKFYINKNFEIKITVYSFFKIPIFQTRINSNKIERVMNNKKVKEIVKKQGTKIIENRRNIDKQLLKSLRNIKLEIEEMDLDVSIGTENASITAFTIPIISTIVSMFFSRKIKKRNNKQIFSITPVYINQNLIKIEFSGIFQIKMIHIINTICTLRKKRKGDKYERTSNRRSYDYGYE